MAFWRELVIHLHEGKKKTEYVFMKKGVWMLQKRKRASWVNMYGKRAITSQEKKENVVLERARNRISVRRRTKSTGTCPTPVELTEALMQSAGGGGKTPPLLWGGERGAAVGFP